METYKMAAYSLEKYAQELIDEVIKVSINRLSSYEDNLIKVEEKENISWPSVKDFSWETGLKSVEEFINKWEVSDRWKYCIDFLGQKEQKYKYRVVWSIPTRRKPVPRATASVYFTLVAVSEVRRPQYSYPPSL